MNQLTFAPAREEDRDVLATLIDGRSLRELFAGRLGALPVCVSRFGWSAESDAVAARQLLLEAAPDFNDGRFAILVCGECGDLGCGAYSAKIERDGEIVRWSAFGFQNNYDDAVETGRYAHIAALEFSWDDYARTLRTLLERS